MSQILKPDTINELLAAPETVTDLSIDDDFNEDIDITVFCNLKKLFTGCSFNKYINFTKLPLLENLSIQSEYEHPIDLTQNIHLKTLIQSVYDNPINVSNNILLESLICGLGYDDNIDVSNLVNLKILILNGLDFNYQVNISNCLQLEELRFGRSFNFPLDVSNNHHLKILQFGERFNHPIDLTNNSALTYLRFGCDFNQQINIDTLINLNNLRMHSYHFDYPLNTSNNVSLSNIYFLGRYQHSNSLTIYPNTNLTIDNRVPIFVQSDEQPTMSLQEFNEQLMHSVFIKNETVKDLESCPICREDFVNDELITFFPCSELNEDININHCFHTNCIKSWTIEQNASCPLCRTHMFNDNSDDSDDRDDRGDNDDNNNDVLHH